MDGNTILFYLNKMAKCYAVLWIPTVNHIPIKFDNPIKGGIRQTNISDNPAEEFNVRIVAKERDIDVLLQNEIAPSEFDHFITLTYEDSSHNGMVKYSYTPTFLGDSEFGFDDATFPEAIYHLIKSLYHVHEFHEDESDSSLQPYVSGHDIDIHQLDNEALRHYLKNYERAVLYLVRSAKTLLRYVVDREKESGGISDIKEYESFPSMYVMALGYDAYIGSLYRSVYNSECRISNEEEKTLRRRAFNIENSVRYFNVLYVFFDTKIRQTNNLAILRKSEESLSTAAANLKETQKSAKSSTRWALWSIIISLAVSLASIGYSIYTANQSSKQLDDVRKELIDTLNGLQTNRK